MVRARRCPFQHPCPLARPEKAARALCEARLVEYLAEAGLDEEGETAVALVRGVVGAVAGKRAPEKPDGPTHRGSEAN
jgi:hypothetical protein